MGAFIGRHVCGVGPHYPTEVKKNETMRLGLENPAAYTDDGMAISVTCYLWAAV
jgi:hypothetical protein